MKNKHLLNFLTIILLSSFSCFSAQDAIDSSPFSINLSKMDWTDKPSVNLAVGFLKSSNIDVVQRFDIACKISTSPDLTEYRKEIIPYRQQIIVDMLELMKNQELRCNERAHIAGRLLQQPWCEIYYKCEDFIPDVIKLIENIDLSFTIRANLVDNSLNYIVRNPYPYELTLYHEKIAAVAIECMQEEQVDVNMRANIVYSFFSHSELSSYYKEIAPVAIKLMQDERVDVNMRASIITYKFFSHRLLSDYDQEIAPVAIALMQNEQVAGNIRTNIAHCLLTIPELKKSNEFHKLILQISIKLLNDEKIHSNNKAYIVKCLLSIPNLNDFYQLIQPIAINFLKEQQEILQRRIKAEKERRIGDWVNSLGKYAPSSESERKKSYERFQEITNMACMRKVDSSPLAIEESYQKILEHTIKILAESKSEESYKAIMPFAVKLLTDTEVDELSKTALGFAIASIRYVSNPEGHVIFDEYFNSIEDPEYSYLNDFLEKCVELNRISAAEKAKRGFEFAAIKAINYSVIKPNNKVAPQQPSAASSSSNVPSQQPSAASSSSNVPSQQSSAIGSTKRQKIRAADFSLQSKQTSTSSTETPMDQLIAATLVVRD